jgi:hypothetical protein
VSVEHGATHDDQPLAGIVYNTKELSAIEYDCELAKNDHLTCKFTQMSVLSSERCYGQLQMLSPRFFYAFRGFPKC